MKTAVVIEIKGNTAVVMKTGGEFARVQAKAGWAKGDVVTIAAQKPNRKALAAIAACLVLLLFGALGGYRLYYTGTALISVDVNPSIELTLNRFGRVLSAAHYNVEGEDALAGLDLKGKSYEEALEALFQSDALRPYLENGAYLDVAVSGGNELETQVDAQIRSYTASYRLRLSCRSVDDETVAAAHAHGMTPGRYLAFLELEALDASVSIEDYSSCGLGQIRSEIDSHHQNQYGQEEEHGNRNQHEGNESGETPASGSHNAGEHGHGNGHN